MSGALGTLSPEPTLGSALRVEALGSRLLLDSPVGGSTKVEIELPLGLHASSLP